MKSPICYGLDGSSFHHSSLLFSRSVLFYQVLDKAGIKGSQGTHSRGVYDKPDLLNRSPRSNNTIIPSEITARVPASRGIAAQSGVVMPYSTSGPF